MADLKPKSVRESRVELNQLMLPENANALGNVHGGEIMKLVDTAGGLAAMRHARRPAVTVVMDSVTFLEPVYVGNLLHLTAELTYVGRTSMEARIEVVAEDVITGSCTQTNVAYAVYVALDDHGRPTQVPPLIFETEEQRQRSERARERQAYRLAQKRREQAPISPAGKSDGGA